MVNSPPSALVARSRLLSLIALWLLFIAAMVTSCGEVLEEPSSSPSEELRDVGQQTSGPSVPSLEDLSWCGTCELIDEVVSFKPFETTQTWKWEPCAFAYVWPGSSQPQCINPLPDDARCWPVCPLNPSLCWTAADCLQR